MHRLETYRHSRHSRLPALTGLCLLALSPWVSARNVILFVADGLRPGAVTVADMPTLSALRARGTYFANSHSVYPTLTMVNAAALATGRQPGETGIVSNNPWIAQPLFASGNFGKSPGSPLPLIENDQVLADLNGTFGGNLLGAPTLLSQARAAGYGTLSIGKLGPAALQDVTQLQPLGKGFAVPTATLVDDSTGPEGVPLPAAATTALEKARLPTVPTTRIQPQGDMTTPGTRNANWGQQVYFVEAATRALMPDLRQQKRPFVLVYWSRDPDGTQHNHGDGPGELTPGINGATTKLGLRNADHNLQLLLDWLATDPAVAADTDVVVVSDHGFATVSRQAVDAALTPTSSPSARISYSDVRTGQLPPGFMSLDLARDLQLPVFDPDRVVNTAAGLPVYAPVDVAAGHTTGGSALLGGTGRIDGAGDADILVAVANGSDVLYLPRQDPALVRRIVASLARRDYIDAIFVDDRFGPLEGTLPLSAINLRGHSTLPLPTLVVAFRSFELPRRLAPGVTDPLLRTAQVTNATQQQGQGHHGGFGRAITFNFMAAAGPDFRAGYVDRLPAGNADIAPTLRQVLQLPVDESGSLHGRVLTEALRGSAVAPAAPRRCTLVSPKAADGRSTILSYQEYDGRRYLDRAEYRVTRQSEGSSCASKGS